MNKIVMATFYLAFVSVVTAGPRASGARVTVECEDTTATYDKLFSPIAVMAGGSCSGGYMVVGVDCPGEWIESDLNVTALGTWSVGLRCRGDFSVSYTMRVTLTGKQSGNSQSIDLFFVGTGFT